MCCTNADEWLGPGIVCTYLAIKNKKKILICDFQGTMVLNTHGLICTSTSTAISQQKLRHPDTGGTTWLREDFVNTTNIYLLDLNIQTCGNPPDFNFLNLTSALHFICIYSVSIHISPLHHNRSLPRMTPFVCRTVI